MSEQEEIRIIGDGHIVWCAWCKATRDVPDDCNYCFETLSITVASSN